MAEHQYVSIAPLLKQLTDASTSKDVRAEDIAAAIALLFDNLLSTEQCGCLLGALRLTGRDRKADLIAMTAARMRDAAFQVDQKGLRQTIAKRGRREGSYRGGLCDIVGTGGDGHSTFNVSTASSIVASSLLLISKHGSKASSSKSGSSDMLQAIAPRAPQIEAVTADTLPKVYEKGNYAFLFAPIFHSAMKHVAPIRKTLGFPTIFNVLGPLVNPVESMLETRICGVLKRSLGPVYAEALRLGGARKALVVCGAEDMDEISCAGKTYCWRLSEKSKGSKSDGDSTSDEEDLSPESVEIDTFGLEPSDFGLPTHSLEEVRPGKGPGENAEILVKMLNNELPRDDPVLHFVLMNTAALFVMSGICDANTTDMGEGDSRDVITETGSGGGRWKEGVRRARWAIESGAARKQLEQFIAMTKELAG